MTAVKNQSQATVNIPAPSDQLFVEGIVHPELWLWDSWVMRRGDDIHLYCLALARHNSDGAPVTVFEFNNYPFHFRHFRSNDEGQSWRDEGAVLSPGNMKDGSDAKNVWSGSVFSLPNEEVLFGYTGIEHRTPAHQFVQTINFATGTQGGPVHFSAHAQSHPVRDRDAIFEAGYYLPDVERIGHNDGEDGGPITAWRDPFVFEDREGTLHALWSAKVGPQEPAVAHAILKRNEASWTADLQAPIRLPDADGYTQAEVPKLCLHEDSGDLFMMISACDRLHEQQPDHEITKSLRLYRAANIAGPWRPAFAEGSTLQGVEHLFGASFLDRSFAGSTFQIIAPHTVKAGRERQLTFAPVKTISIAPSGPTTLTDN